MDKCVGTQHDAGQTAVCVNQYKCRKKRGKVKRKKALAMARAEWEKNPDQWDSDAQESTDSKTVTNPEQGDDHFDGEMEEMDPLLNPLKAHRICQIQVVETATGKQNQNEVEDCRVSNRSELQSTLSRRNTRGGKAPAMLRFRRSDDPMLFCSNYLALYRNVCNHPDMSQNDPSFLFSMANHCNVDYATRVSLRNTSSYERFVKLLTEWCLKSKEQDEVSENVSTVYRPRYCFKCGKIGHIKRYCNTRPESHSLHQNIDRMENKEGLAIYDTEFTCKKADFATTAQKSQEMQIPTVDKSETGKE
ncbi:uncharacterized protein [Dendrobates tinctorius]|uniref:uncharacterized protein n=1 Tax=Dendrobates tinctorius TaxID=92724 RepID=UPI003CC951B1